MALSDVDEYESLVAELSRLMASISLSAKVLLLSGVSSCELYFFVSFSSSVDKVGESEEE